MNQTQRKTLSANLQKIRDHKLNQAMVAFMSLAPNRPVVIPQPSNHSFQKMILTLMGQESEAKLKVPVDDVINSISGNSYFNYGNIPPFFNARNQREIDNALSHNTSVKEREKTELGATRFRINREYNDRLDNITLSDDYAACVALVEEFKNFTL